MLGRKIDFKSIHCFGHLFVENSGSTVLDKYLLKTVDWLKYWFFGITSNGNLVQLPKLRNFCIYTFELRPIAGLPGRIISSHSDRPWSIWQPCYGTYLKSVRTKVSQFKELKKIVIACYAEKSILSQSTVLDTWNVQNSGSTVLDISSVQNSGLT